MFDFGAFLLSSQLIVAIADQVPAIDLQRTCKSEAAALQGASVQQDVQACVKDEQGARDELAKSWGTYTANDKQVCTNMAAKGYLPGYVELLTCVEMFQFAKIPADQTDQQSTTRPPGQRQPRRR